MRLGLEHIMLFSKGTTLHFDKQGAHFFTHCDKEGAPLSMLLPCMKHSYRQQLTMAFPTILGLAAVPQQTSELRQESVCSGIQEIVKDILPEVMDV